MEEEVLQSLYTIAKENGYMKDSFEFQKLMNDDEEARKTMYDISLQEGYTKSFDDFTELVTPSKKKIEERIKERESALNSEIIFSESYETEDANPIFSALNEGWRQGRLVEALSPILGDISDISDEELDYLIETNNKLQSVPKSRQRKEYDEAFTEALNDNLKELQENPFGDLEAIEKNFKKGKFTKEQEPAYLEYREANILNKELLPKKEISFIDDLGAFYEAVTKTGVGTSATALAEISLSSLVSMGNFASASAGVGAAAAAGGITAATGIGAPAAPLAALSGLFAGGSAVMDAALRFNEYLNEVLQQKGLDPNKENYRIILEDKDLIRDLRAKAVKGGITVGAVDGLTMMLSGSVGAKGAVKMMQRPTRISRGLQALETTGKTTLLESTGGGAGEALAQKAAGEEFNGRSVIEEALAEGPVGVMTAVVPITKAAYKSYKIKGEPVSKETYDDFVENISDEDILAIELSVTNDKASQAKTSSRIKKAKAKKNIDPDITDEVKRDRLAEKQLEIDEAAKLDGESGKIKLRQKKKEFADILEGKAETVEDIGMSDLEQLLKDEGVQFQLSAEATPEEKKAELIDIAIKQMESSETPDTASDVYEATDSDVELTRIQYDKTQPLASDIEKSSVKDLKGKKINLVMADQLKVGEVNTSTGKKLTTMGGVFFSAIPELRNKIAWASIDLKSARDIVRGAIKSDETAVFNMKPSAIDSNKALINYAFEEIKGKTKNEKSIFKQFKEYISGLKFGEDTQSVRDFLEDKNSFDDVLESFDQLNVNARSAIVKKTLPTESVSTKIPYLKNVLDLGVTIESARTANIEESLQDVPMGSLLSTLEITDKDGSPITDVTKIDDAIVTRDQAKKEGLPLHENYPIYVRGKIKTLIDETTPFWNVVPQALNTIDAKVAGVVVGKKGEFTSKQARAAEQRRATMQAAKAKRVEEPKITQYQRFVNLVSKSIPGVSIITDEAQFNEFRDDIYSQKMITKSQKIYGAVRGNTLYLNPDLENYNTPVHEFGHVWINTVKTERPDLYNKGIELIQNSEYTSRVKKSKEYIKVIKELKGKGLTESDINNYINEEALATAIGDKGESFAKASILRNFKEWLQNLYDFIKTKLGISQYSAEEIENLSLDEFTESVAVDILKGEPLFEESQVKTIDELQLQLEDSNIYEIIRVARNNGFPDSVIEKFLQKKGFKKKEIAEAKKINVNALQELPASFYNAGTTALDGLSLFEKAFDYAKKRVKKYGSEKAIELTTDNLIKKSPIFKKSDDIIKEEMIRDFGKFMGKKFKSAPSPENVLMGIGRAIILPKERASLMSEDMKKYRMRQRDFDKGAKNLLSLQREIRNFVRKYIPKAQYKKSEVNKLIKIITDAKTPNNVASAIREVEDIILTMHNKELLSKVDKLRNLKTTSKQSGKAIGRSVSVEVSDRISKINKNIETKTEEDIVGLLKEETTANDINDLLIAGDYLSALSQDDKSFGKMLSLSELESDFRQLINQGRNQRAEKKLAIKKQQQQNKAVGLNEIYGFDIDINQLDKVDVSEQQSRKNQTRINKAIRGFGKEMDKARGWMLSDLTDIMDLLSRTTGEMIGGKLEDMVTMRFKAAENTYKAGKMHLMDDVINKKLAQLFGKNWKIEMRSHGIKKYTGIKLKSGLELELSQSEAYYLYNQSKDPSNNKSFEKKYGENYKDILKQIEGYLDPNVKKWADYQTDILFPMLYERYNETYREMYDTNLPWNNKYAGRIYREGLIQPDIDIIEKPLSYRNSVSGPSTKERVRTTSPIKNFDGNSALSSYILDMEQFRAYATAVRDIDALFKDPDIRKAIERTSGKGILGVVDEFIKAIANRGQSRSAQADIINIGIDMFVTARLGLNPIIAIKQLTSIPAYTADIGLKNWVKYSPKAMSNFSTTWKEIADNSVYIKDRYNKGIQDALKASQTKSTEEIVPNKYKEGINDYVSFMLKMIQYGDKGGITGGLPNYLYYKDQFISKNPKGTEQQTIDYAIKKFEYDTSKAQQSYDLTDRDLLQMNPYARSFLPFTTTPKQYARKSTQSIRQLRRWATGQKYKRSIGRNLYQLMLYRLGLPLIFQYVSLGLPGLFTKFEDEDADDLIRAAILGNINAYFAIGDLFTTILDYAQDKPWAGEIQSYPIIEGVVASLKSWDRALENPYPEKDRELYMKAWFDTAANLGLPISTYKYADFIADWLERDMDPREVAKRSVGYSEYQAKKGLK